MATRKLRVLAEAIGFNKIAREARLVEKRLISLAAAQKKLSRAAGADLTGVQTARLLGQNQAVLASGKALRKNVKIIDQNRGALKGFQMEYLSTMFFGMQVWRTFGGFFKSMLTTMKDLDKKGTNPLNRALTKLEASFTFLKFAIADALGPAFVQFVINVAEALLALAEADPARLRALGLAIGVIAIGGLAMFTLSQVALFHNAVNDILMLGKEGKPGLIKNMGTSLKSVGLALAGFAVKNPALAALVAITTALATITVRNEEAAKKFKDEWTKTGEALKKVGNEILESLKVEAKIVDGWTFLAATFLWMNSILQLLVISFADVANIAIKMSVGVSKIIIGGLLRVIDLLLIKVDFLFRTFAAMADAFPDAKISKKVTNISNAIKSLREESERVGGELIKEGFLEDLASAGEAMVSPVSEDRIFQLFEEIAKGPTGIMLELDETRKTQLDAEIEKAKILNKILGEVSSKLSISPFEQLASDILGTPQSYAQVPTVYGSE